MASESCASRKLKFSLKVYMGRAVKNWMQGAVKKPGALRKALHVKKGQKIPEYKLEKAEHSKNPHMRKMANLAETFKKHRPK